MAQDFGEIVRDDLLAVRAQQGDSGAFETLVARWQQPMLRYACRAIGNQEEAWDAVQETWLAVITGILKLKDITRFRTWLFQILTHKCQDRWRQKARYEGVVRKAAASAIRSGSAEKDTVSDLIKSLLGQLPPESRAALTLKYWEGFSVGEIAEVLGVPEGTVKSRLYYARETIRQAIERDRTWKNGNSN